VIFLAGFQHDAGTTYSSSPNNQAKIEVSAGGKATITFLPIITSRDYRYSLSDLRTWLVYLQKITEHNDPFMPALMKASTYIIVHYRNNIHALSRCMDSIQPQTLSV
jgi:hypothetical protein